MYQTHFVRDEFLERIQSSTQSLLMLDYDGTLAPFVEQRERANPYAGIPELITEIMAQTATRVVIVSGRPATEVVTLLDLPDPPEIWGGHGLERRKRNGESKIGRVDRRSASALREAFQWTREQGLDGQVEQKPGSLAIHWRGFSSQQIEDIYQNARLSLLPLTRVSRLSLTEFDGGIELRVRNCNKGHVVQELLNEMGDVPAAYLGDDRTDEDAFRALQGRGLTVLVRKELRPTAAELWLCPPEELISFLSDWLRASRRHS